MMFDIITASGYHTLINCIYQNADYNNFNLGSSYNGFDIMFGMFEISLIMSGAILLLALAGKLLGSRTKAAKRHLLWLIIAAALLVPVRPLDLSIPVTALPPAADGIVTAAVDEGMLPIEANVMPWQMQNLVMAWQNFRNSPFGAGNENSGMFGTGTNANGTNTNNTDTVNDGSQTTPGTAANENSSATQGTHAVRGMAHGGRLSLQSIVQFILSPSGLFTFWAGGALVFFISRISRHKRFTRSTGNLCTIVSDSHVLDIMDDVKASLGIKQEISLLTSPVSTTPLLVGIFRPKIILPKKMLLEDSEEIRLILLHEAIHVKRKDLLTWALSQIALAVHWFNPAVHWLAKKTMEEAEYATDDAVLQHMGENYRFRYSRMLLSVTGKSIMPDADTAFAYGLTSGGKKLKKRLKNIVVRARIPRWIGVSSMCLLLAVTLLFSMMGCGTLGGSSGDSSSDQGIPGANSNGTQSPAPGDNGDVSHIIDPDRSQFDGETLTIFMWSEYSIERTVINKFRRANPGVTVDVVTFWDDSFMDIDYSDAFNNAKEELRVQLMSGTAPVLIQNNFIDDRDPRVAMYLLDWFPVIMADPGFNEDDWFMNVFHSEAVHEKLYVFPSSFSYYNVTVNDTVPGLRAALSGREGITMPELIELHHEFAADTGLLIDSNFDLGWLIDYNLDSFLDFESGWVDFNNERFIDLIVEYRALTSPDIEFGWLINSSGPILRDQELLWSERYLFNIVSPGLNFIQYYTDFETGPLFFEHIPLVNERGELLTYSWGSYALNANATPVEQALAWEFIKFINDADNSGAMSFNGLQQTNRNTFRKGVEAAMTRTSVFDGAIRYLHQFGWQARLSEAETVQNTTALLESFGEMPMTRARNIPDSIWAAIFDALQLFHEGVVSAEQTAADLQNKIELMLMEMGR